MRLHLEWGPTGARRYASRVAVSVVVDVLSFTTAVTVAADRGIQVLPYSWDDAGAADLAFSLDATLAVSRREAGPGQVSLSPSSVRDAPAGVERLVLPSPNGSTICALLGAGGAGVVAASLRNRAAVAAHLSRLLAADPDAAVLLVPAGERWPDGSLRPAIEDLWGAGAVVAAVQDLAGDEAVVGEEAAAAAAAYRLVEGRLEEALFRVFSGRELRDRGYSSDVTIAAELDASGLVPVLTDGVFVAATGRA